MVNSHSSCPYWPRVAKETTTKARPGRTRKIINHSMPGGACLWSNGIRSVEVSNNTMSAAAGAHGIMANGGKLTINGGTISTMGPYISTALGVGPSSGGATGYLDVTDMSTISGSVIPSEQGYIKLTGNQFSNAIVFDVEAGRLINDPMAEGNSGLRADQDIAGCLIDWNDDNHNCPDYPPRCDEWDEEMEQCGCGQDGIDPPSEPAL